MREWLKLVLSAFLMVIGFVVINIALATVAAIGMMCMSPRPIQYIAPLLGIIGGLAMFVAGVAFAFEKPNKRRHKR